MELILFVIAVNFVKTELDSFCIKKWFNWLSKNDHLLLDGVVSVFCVGDVKTDFESWGGDVTTTGKPEQ